VRKILITGNKGYIGSVLENYLLLNGYKDITGLDNFYYYDCKLTKTDNSIKTIRKDIRFIEKADIKDFDTVIHLAGLSNDPVGELNSQLTKDINFSATIKLAEIAREVNVKQFIYFSSQSMYGISNDSRELDEDDSEKNPITEYAKTKWMAEKILRQMGNKNFTVSALRPSTVFGPSPFLRTDIVFNNLMSHGLIEKKVIIKSDGTPIRPVVNIYDVCLAVKALLETSPDIINNQAYNIGIKNGNFTIKEMAETVRIKIPGSEIIYTNEHGNDARTYAVSFSKIFKSLGNIYKPKWDLNNGADDINNFLKNINFTKGQLNSRMTNRLRQINYLIQNKKINENLEWIV